MNNRSKYLAIIIVAAVIGAAVAYYSNSSAVGSSFIRYDNVRTSSSAISQLYGIANNVSLADTIGIGTVPVGPKGALPIITNSNTPLVGLNGRLMVLYVGADYCPFCAVTRWSLILALMRFGNFTELHYMTSSAVDYAPNTPTFTFYNSAYSSHIINFTAFEIAKNIFNSTIDNYEPLQTVPSRYNNIMVYYSEKYTGSPNYSIPIIDYGNYSVEIGAMADPKLLSNDNWSTIMSDIKNPNTAISQGIVGAADVITAQICHEINNSASVCAQPYVKNYASEI
ncbi:secreted protein containing DUF929 [mine drainage metagenome]|uniref:Secreted protein containing DUF929 n=1 Tax=mine drainage metagenome TaxID=410659 RepID=T0YAK5_9ZZZZ